MVYTRQNMPKFIKIKHPEWLSYSNASQSIDLFRAGRLPPEIQGWMIVVGLKHPLRAVYGSDLKAAIALLFDALLDKLRFLKGKSTGIHMGW